MTTNTKEFGGFVPSAKDKLVKEDPIGSSEQSGKDWKTPPPS
jgi:hypothetical protein